MAEIDDKLKYAQTLINVLQAKLNESISTTIQLEAKIINLQEEKKASTDETPTKEK
tara:strand:- start:298 stop:465 length:168 start_codon:yes stop_codon:yes gene_type:complete